MDIDYTVGEVELSYKPKFKKLHQGKSVQRTLINTYFLPIRRELSVTKNILKSCF